MASIYCPTISVPKGSQTPGKRSMTMLAWKNWPAVLNRPENSPPKVPRASASTFPSNLSTNTKVNRSIIHFASLWHRSVSIRFRYRLLGKMKTSHWASAFHQARNRETGHRCACRGREGWTMCFEMVSRQWWSSGCHVQSVLRCMVRIWSCFPRLEKQIRVRPWASRSFVLASCSVSLAIHCWSTSPSGGILVPGQLWYQRERYLAACVP